MLRIYYTFAKKHKIMKKLYLTTLIFNVCILSAMAQNSAKQDAQQPVDSIKITTGNAGMTTINNVNLGKKYSTLHKLKVYKIDSNATKTPKYDAFKESMKKEPLAVDLLKDIAGHLIK